MTDFFPIKRLPPYVFEQVNKIKAQARAQGADIIDLGMGNPDLPAPPHVIEKLCETAGKPRTDRYSASKGIAGLRRAQAAYYGRRFGVKLNPETQVIATLGSKRASPTWPRRSPARATWWWCRTRATRSTPSASSWRAGSSAPSRPSRPRPS